MEIDLLEEESAEETPAVLEEKEPGFLARAWPWLAAIFVVGLTVSCFPIQVSNDPWWHLKTGQVLIKFMDGWMPRFPAHDVFSVSGADKEWANHEWLADMLMFAVYELAGLRFLIFLKSLTFIAAFLLAFIYAWRRTGELVIPGLIVLLAVLSSQWTAYLRPPIFSYFFVALYLNLLWSLEKSERPVPIGLIAAMAGSMILWVNLHGGAILGIVITGLWLFGNILNGIQERVLRGHYDFSRFVPWIAALVIIFVASLVNPFTYDIHLLPFKVMGDEGVVLTNSELQMPDFRYVTSYNAYAIITVLAFAFAAARRWRRIRYADVLLVAFFLWQSLSHVRHLPLFALVAAAPTCFWIQQAFRPRSLDEISELVDEPTELEARESSRPRRVVTALLAIILAIVWVDTSLLTIPRTPAPEGVSFTERIGPGRFFRHVNYWMTPEGFVASQVAPNGQVYWNYPVEAVDFLLAAEKVHELEFPGTMFNTINHSGYLIWRLSPEHHKVLTDSRFDIHGEDYLFDVLAVERGLPLKPELMREWDEATGERREELDDRIEAARDGVIEPYWQEVLKQHNIGFMIIEMDKPVVEYLFKANSGWAPVYRDNSYAILIRDIAPHESIIARVRDFFERWQARGRGL